jgi:hypothetical protein
LDIQDNRLFAGGFLDMLFDTVAALGISLAGDTGLDNVL